MTQVSGGAGALSAGQLGQLNRLATSARLIAGLAHELNNSLQVVSGLVELLTDHAEVPPDAAARIRKIGLQAEKASATIRQVLGYTREGPPEQRRPEIARVVERALGLRRYNLGRAGIAVTTELPTGLATSVDERGLVQVVLNLILNAEDALTGQPTRELHIAAHRDAGGIRLTVRDTGHGIADDIRERIFEPFFTTRSDTRAVGLGLPVAQAIAAAGGGSVSLAESRAGATTFLVEIPG